MQVDSSKFVQRKGLRLVLNGQTYKFAGASNYYMLTRAVEKVTRPQVLLVTPALAIVNDCMTMGMCVLLLYDISEICNTLMFIGTEQKVM